jgi:hypothetical protein
MSDPSLLNIPYRFKASKLYSQIPDSGLGDFVVSRSASNAATRVNASGFIETVADNVPRLDYPLGGIANGCPALLVEPSAQNTCLQSQDFTTTWSVINTTRTANQSTSPDNTLTADRISITSNGGYIRQLLAASNSLTYTLSCFVKNDAVASGDTFRLYFNNNVGAPNGAVANATININAGTVSAGSSGAGVSSVSAGIENYGNGWYRVRVTFTLGASAGSASSEIGFEAPTATRTFFAWGAQFETGSIATSYIPTTTAPITRGADLVSKTGVSSLIGQTEGTIYLEVEQDPLNRDIFSLNTGAGNSIIFYKNSSNIVNARLYANSSTIFTIANAVATNGFVKIALAYKAGDSAMVINAGTAQTSASSFIFSSALSLVSLTPSWFTNAGFTKIRAVALYPTRLTNAQLQALTT